MTVEEHKLQHIAISDLKFDETNPNQLTEEQMEGLRQSMQKFGYLTPIVIDQNNMIADGEHRALVYKEFGYTEIPCFKLNLENDIDRRILRQVMNKLHGEHDRQKDANELLQIFNNNRLDELVELIARPKEELQNLLSKYHGIQFQTEDNFDVDKTLENLVPETKLGDIWQLGNHRLICADCTDERSVKQLTENKQIELMLTDPPYGISIVQLEGSSDGGSKPNTIGRVGSTNIVEANYYRPIQGDDKDFDPKHLLSLGKNQIIFGANYFADKLPISSGWLVWYKRHEDWDRTTFAECELAWSSYDIPSRFYSVTWMGLIKEGEHGRRLHPTQKPIKLLADIIKDFTREQNIILDPYLGSGSTLIACEQTDRICFGAEIDPHYCDVIVKRWESFTGKKAEKLSEQQMVRQDV